MQMDESKYQDMLKEEAEIWAQAAREWSETAPPDWLYTQDLRYNILSHKESINGLLQQIQPGMRVLELGCSNGWLSIAMARQGAIVDGLDISEDAMAIGRDYYESIRESISGSVTYQQGDLNKLDLKENYYDLVVTKGTLHHLIHLPELVDMVNAALKPGQLFWIHDTNGHETMGTVLLSSFLMFILPTYVSYKDKFVNLFKFGFRAPSRIKMSMEAEGLSPFEGAGREHDWLKIVNDQFSVEKQIPDLAITSYLSQQIRLSDKFALPILKVIRFIDRSFMKLGLIKSTGITVYAYKKDRT